MKTLLYRFWAWWYRRDLVTLFKSFEDPKYPRTGRAQTKEDLMQFARLNGWSPRKFNRVFNMCIRFDIIQDMPLRTVTGRNQPKTTKYNHSKQFFYILNPELLQ